MLSGLPPFNPLGYVTVSEALALVRFPPAFETTTA
jgi:hypothetical protein